LFIDNLVIEVRFLVLTGITFVAMTLFIMEGLALYRKLNPKQPSEK